MAIQSCDAVSQDEPGRPTVGTFRCSDGYVSYFRRYLPPGPPCGRIIMIHGIQSHGGWYTRSCARFAESGYIVDFLDRRGSGMNTAYRGDIPSFRRVLDDIGEFIRGLPVDGLPRLLVGISWGGKLGVGLQYRHPGLVDGLLLLCPGIVSRVRPSFRERMRIARAFLTGSSAMFPIPLNDPKLFTASPEWQQYIAHDRYALREATARLLFASVALDFYLKRAGKRVNLPVLLLLAEHDQIIDNARVRAYVERLPSTDKQIIEYPGSHHTLEFEPANHPWLQDVLRWLDRFRPTTGNALLNRFVRVPVPAANHGN